MNRPARFTTADLRRALQAAKQVGPDYAVEVLPDGTIKIVRDADRKDQAKTSIEAIEEIVL